MKNIFNLKDITFFLNDRVPLVLTGNDYVIKYSDVCFVIFQIGHTNQTGKYIKERNFTVSIIPSLLGNKPMGLFLKSSK